MVRSKGIEIEGQGGRFILDEDLIKKLYLSGHTTKQIAKTLKVSVPTIKRRLKKMNLRKNASYVFNHDSFEKFTPDSCYWAGFIAADGCISKQSDRQNRLMIELSDKDTKHLENFSDYLQRVPNKIYKRTTTRNGTLCPLASINVCSNKISENLSDNFNIGPAKSFTLIPPKNIPDAFISHYIRGFMDGDGHVGCSKNAAQKKQKRLIFYSASKDILEWILCHIETYTDNSATIHKMGTLYRLGFYGQRTTTILNWIYNNSNEHNRLSRKHEKFITLKGQ